MRKLIHIIARIGLIVVTTGLSTTTFADVINVDSNSLKQLLEQQIPVIDVRRAEEWQETGVIENSHLITFFDNKGQYDTKKWLNELSAFVVPHEPVVLICHSGARSKLISQWLSEKQGYSTVYNVTNGIMSWKQSGGAIHPFSSMSQQ